MSRVNNLIPLNYDVNEYKNFLFDEKSFIILAINLIIIMFFTENNCSDLHHYLNTI